MQPNQATRAPGRPRLGILASFVRPAAPLAALLLAALLSIATGATGWAQQPPRSGGGDVGGTGPLVLVPTEPKAQPLAVTRLIVEARVLGLRAETTLTATFHNPANRVIAGDLYLPLPEGATVSGYALDVDGDLVQGVVVEKRKGREVFETETRKGVDPGLVEWARGNTFKTRVFPIPARGDRTVRVRYVSELDERGAPPHREAVYRLPLRVQGTVDTVSVRIEASRAESAPEVRAGGLPGLSFGRWRAGWVAETVLRKVKLERDLVVAMPENPLDSGEPSVHVETAPDGHTYFAIDDRPPAPNLKPLPPPRHIALYWDATASRTDADVERAVRALRAYFQSRRSEPATVTLILFRDTPETARRFTVGGRNAKADADELSALLATCAQAVRDGGTRLDNLPPPPPGVEAVFLVTDGLVTLGRGAFPHAAAPVYALGGGAGGDHSALRALARRSGGAYLNLSRLEDADVVAGLNGSRYRFLGAQFDTGTVTDGYPLAGQPIALTAVAGVGETSGRFLAGRLAYVGRLKGKSARVTLSYGVGDLVLHHRTVVVTVAESVPGDLLRVTWAQARLADLLLEPRVNEARIVALGREQSLVTPGTSLIVLERPEQYAEHGIEPPATKPDWRARYRELVARQERLAHTKQVDKLAYLRKLWRERVQWWETEFDYPPDFRYEPPPREKPRSMGVLDRMRETFTQERSEPLADGGDLRANAPAPAREAVAKAEAKGKADAGGSPAPTVSIVGWDPKTPYLDALKAAKSGAAYAEYLTQRQRHGTAPAFYLDVGDFFAARGEAALAERIWSNLAELELENPALLRVLAHRLAQAERLEVARLVFADVLRMRPEEPQSHRDLAGVLARLGQFGPAVQHLGHVVLGDWDGRFPEIELIALEELNRIWPQARASGADELPVPPDLVALLDVDVRIVLTWDADQADMDLHVVEPSGEEAFYGHRRTTIGGLVSHDLTGGYGPEEYLVHRAMKGPYKVYVKYYANRAPSLTGSVTLQVEIFTRYGREDEQRQAVTVRLRQNKETLKVAEVTF